MYQEKCQRFGGEGQVLLASPVEKQTTSDSCAVNGHLRSEDWKSASCRREFSQRAELSELMDQPCSYEDLRACLHDIARVNRLTRAHKPTIDWLQTVLAAKVESASPLRVLDVGCGYGDMLRTVDRWAARRGIALHLTGIDLNPDAVRAAKEVTNTNQNIEWLVGDALSNPAAESFDVVISSLMTHHLNNSEVVIFLSWMERYARRGWFINDLHRKPLPYHLFRLWSRFTNWHPFVKHDGPVSIRRSFVAEDWQSLCALAGIAKESVSVQRFVPARLCVGRIK